MPRNGELYELLWVCQRMPRTNGMWRPQREWDCWRDRREERGIKEGKVCPLRENEKRFWDRRVKELRCFWGGSRALEVCSSLEISLRLIHEMGGRNIWWTEKTGKGRDVTAEEVEWVEREMSRGERDEWMKRSPSIHDESPNNVGLHKRPTDHLLTFEAPVPNEAYIDHFKP